ncbi:MAG: hypothetical protein ICV62_02975 [Cyanobacteria bacterium Co-bin13]|nr:hypothetical protein [Cyanobacteria bacterium Co-bin13]
MQAFEARWLDLRGHHPTTRDDNTVIAHAMGQLIDQYQPPVQVENALPEHLKGLFRELAFAYFRGYVPDSETAVAELTGAQPRSNSPARANSDQREISAAVEKVRALAQKALCSVHPSRGCCPDNPNEADTLIIEFPEGWPI